MKTVMMDKLTRPTFESLSSYLLTALDAHAVHHEQGGKTCLT
jgi:hypothetical protein